MKTLFIPLLLLFPFGVHLSAHPSGHDGGPVETFIHFVTDPHHLGLALVVLVLLSALFFFGRRRKSGTQKQLRD